MDWKQEWKNALLSGKYKQGNNSLRNNDCYCCLGILCDLSASKGVGYWEETSDSPIGFILEDKWKSELPPEGFYDAIGFPVYLDQVSDLKGFVSKLREIVRDTDRDRFNTAINFALDKKNISYVLLEDIFSGLNDTGYSFDTIAQLIDYL